MIMFGVVFVGGMAVGHYILPALIEKIKGLFAKAPPAPPRCLNPL